MKLHDLKKRLLSRPEYKKEYERYDLAFEIGQMVIEARILKGITQEKLADLVKTKQPSIARLESGNSLPSLSFLQKIAQAFGTHLEAPKFAFLRQEEFLATSYSEGANWRQEYKSLVEAAEPTELYSIVESDSLTFVQ